MAAHGVDLGNDPDTQAGILLADSDGCPQPGAAAADNEDVMTQQIHKTVILLLACPLTYAAVSGVEALYEQGNGWPDGELESLVLSRRRGAIVRLRAGLISFALGTGADRPSAVSWLPF
jgi:hypothetical protein